MVGKITSLGISGFVMQGTNLNSQALDETKNNYLMSIVYLGDVLGVAIADYYRQNILLNIQTEDVIIDGRDG